MAAHLPRGARAALASRGTFHCYYNIITYHKNSIIYTTTDDIYNANNTIFYSNLFNYNKN
jgi:hypothetical protein